MSEIKEKHIIKKRKKITYLEICTEVEKPFNERTSKSIGRCGKDIVPRKYHLTIEEKNKIIEKSKAMGMRTINPFCGRIGLYYGQVQALIELGINKYHSFKDCFNKSEEILSVIKDKNGVSAWDKAILRKGKSTANKPKSIEGKIHTNFQVLQRLPKDGKNELNPYGIKLAQFGLCVDIEWRKPSIKGMSSDDLPAIPYFRLNTQSWDSWDPGNGPCLIKPILRNQYKKRKRKDNKIKVEKVEKD